MSNICQTKVIFTPEHEHKNLHLILNFVGKKGRE